MQSGNKISTNYKVNTIDRLGIGVHFEDSVEQAEDITQKTNAIVVIVPHPWNWSYQPENDRIIVAKDHIQKPEAVRAFLAFASSQHVAQY